MIVALNMWVDGWIGWLFGWLLIDLNQSSVKKLTIMFNHFIFRMGCD